MCRALATESIELRVFLSKVFTNDTEALRIKADAESSRQELAKLKFSDWVSVERSMTSTVFFMINVEIFFGSDGKKFNIYC